jgi:hypothetical protein
MNIDLTGAIVCFDEAHNLGLSFTCFNLIRIELQ